MATIKFGRQQLGKPTPANIGFAVTIINVIAGAVQVWMMSAKFIPAHVSEVIGGFLGLVILLSNALKPFFGAHITEDTVPVEEVREVETEVKK